MLLQALSRLTEPLRPTPSAAETFAAFLAPPTLHIMRWQRWLVIMTLIIGVLTVDICAHPKDGRSASEAPLLLCLPG